MSAGVLFDAPGPVTRARHRTYTVVAIVALLAVLAFLVYKLNEAGQFAYEEWEPLLTPRYIRALLVDGLLVTLQIAFLAVLFAVVFGVIFGAGKLSDHAVIRWPSWLVVEFFRAVPVILLMVFCFYAIFGGFENLDSRTYWAAVLALTLYNGSVLAEVFRAGVNAVPKGQAEAAYAIGMRKGQVMNIVLLPQAVKIMLPAIISQCVVALKDTSLIYIIAGAGLTKVGKSIFTGFGNHFQVIFVVAALYVVVNLLLTALATWVQKRFVGEKKPLEVALVGSLQSGQTPL
jgi:glutamate transport system permease protein